jgi:signal transduction histidine kinase
MPERAGGRRLPFPSLGARLVGLFLVLAVAVAITFLIGRNAMQRVGWHAYLRPLVANYTDMLVSEIGSPPDIERARLLAQRLPLHIRIDGPGLDWDSADEPAPAAPAAPAWPRHPVVTLPDGAPIPLVGPGPRPPAAASEASAVAPPPRPAARGGLGLRLPSHRLALHGDLAPGDWHVVRRLPGGYRVVIGLADGAHVEASEHVGWATLGVLLLLTALAYAIVRQMLKPLAAIRAGAVRYGQGDFSRPIVPRHPDELGDLAEQINGMAARLHRMLEAKRQLLLAISHELRSPLARARMNAELVAESGERSALLRDLGEMRDLITDLLESERLADVQAGGHAALQTESTVLAELVRAQCGAQAQAGQVTLALAEDLPPLPLDRVRIRLLLRNLVDNALRHAAGAAAAPVVSTAAGTLAGGRAPAALLRVRDFGPGMDEAQIQHASEAFYRADAARQRSTGGVGLGLYLCRLVAEAHGGTLVVRNAHPGLEVEVALPAPSPA